MPTRNSKDVYQKKMDFAKKQMVDSKLTTYWSCDSQQERAPQAGIE